MFFWLENYCGTYSISEITNGYFIYSKRWY